MKKLVLVVVLLALLLLPALPVTSAGLKDLSDADLTQDSWGRELMRTGCVCGYVIEGWPGAVPHA